MSPDEQKLHTLSELSSQLNAESDDLNSVIESLEQRLATMNIGIAVWCNSLLCDSGWAPIKNYDEEVVGQKASGYDLGYARDSGHWRICVRESVQYLDKNGEFDYAETSPFVPLVNAPRIVRVEAAAELDSLLDELIRKASGYIENIKKAKEIAE